MLKKIDQFNLSVRKNCGKLNDRIYFLDEESPGSKEKWCRLIAGQGNLRESATESKPLIFEQG